MLKEFFTRLFAPHIVLLWILLSGAVTLAGPFGTYDGLDWPKRFAYWTLVNAVAIAIAFAVNVFLDRFATGAGVMARQVLVTVLFAATFSPILWFLSLAAAGNRRNLVMGPLRMAGIVLAVPVCVSLIKLLWINWDETSGAAFLRNGAPSDARHAGLSGTAESDPPRHPRLMERIVPDRRGRILHLSVRDHYVDVATEAGVSTLLMRFSDAIAELDSIGGMQVHRSHWVAHDAIEGLERESGRLVIRLAGGRKIPVSRSFREDVLAHGASVGLNL